MKHLFTTILSTCTAGLIITTGVIAAPITGPGGEIVSATTTAALVNFAGGCSGAGAVNCTIDGIISGFAGTFVEWDNISLPDSFTYTLNQPYDITRFLLWNDRGAPDSGIRNFDLIFKDPGGSTVGTFNGTAVPFQGSSPIPETFSVGLQPNVKTVELRVNNSLNPPPPPGGGSFTQFREIEFDGTPVPEPASLMLMAPGMAMWLGRKRSQST